MAYSGPIIARAEARLARRREAHQRKQAALREEIFQKLPRTREITMALRRTMPQAAAAMLTQSPAAVEALRRENLALQDEEAALLHNAGYPADALQDLPMCPVCQDRGWTMGKMCDCLKDLCKAEQVKELSSMLDLKDQSFETFRLDYYDREVWPGQTRSPQENMQNILSACRSYAEFFNPAAGQDQNLLFYGPPGLGKTFLSACIARVVSEKGCSVVYDSAPSVFARFETRRFAPYGDESRQAEDDTRRYLACDLLILDDLGTEFLSPFFQSVLYELVNTRLVEGKSTVISTNLDKEGLRKRYAPQVVSRIEGNYAALPFFGRDIRQRKKDSRL